MRDAISVWHSRHLNSASPPPRLWQSVQWVGPSSDLWARDSGPGEICAQEVPINSHTTLNKVAVAHRLAKYADRLNSRAPLEDAFSLGVGLPLLARKRLRPCRRPDAGLHLCFSNARMAGV